MTSRVRMPLPIRTASASSMNSRPRCPTTATPFSDVTDGVGVVMYARTPGARLITAAAMKLSSSLNPSKVTTATCMPPTVGAVRRPARANQGPVAPSV